MRVLAIGLAIAAIVFVASAGISFACPCCSFPSACSLSATTGGEKRTGATI
jgi:hypothetical protein